MYLEQTITSDSLYFYKKIRLFISNYMSKYYHIATEALQNCHGHIVFELSPLLFNSVQCEFGSNTKEGNAICYVEFYW